MCICTGSPTIVLFRQLGRYIDSVASGGVVVHDEIKGVYQGEEMG